jgi:hypothetical protein
MSEGNGTNGSEPPKKKKGRPRKELPGDNQTVANAREQIETMAGLGISVEKIGLILGVSDDILRNRAKEDASLSRAIKRGRAVAEVNVAEAKYNEAVGVKDVDPETGKVKLHASGQPKYLQRPNITACIWMDKVVFGYRESLGIQDETPRRPGELPQIPLATLREAVRAAEEAGLDDAIVGSINNGKRRA